MQKQLPTRRTLARGAAWAAPTVIMASAAPAYAASPCVDRTLNWGNFQTNEKAPASVDLGTGADAVTVKHSVTKVGSTVLGPLVDYVQSGPMSGVSGNWWRLSMGNSDNPVQSGWSVSTTWTFSRNVTNLRFSILDIDVVTGQTGWSDRVSLTPGFNAVRGNALQGSGSVGSEWNAVNSGDAGSGSSGNRVDVTYPGPLASFTLTYTEGNRGTLNSNMQVGLSNLIFCA